MAIINRHHLFMLVLLRRIVDVVVQSDRLLAFARLLYRQIGDGCHVAQFAQLAAWLGVVVQLFRLLPDYRQTLQGAFQTQVGADDADVVGHDVLQLLAVLEYEYHLLSRCRTLEVPVGDTLLKTDLVYRLRRVADCLVGVDECFGERVGRQTVRAVQPRAGTLAEDVQTLDGTLAIAVHRNSAAAVVRSRAYGNHVFRYVDADGQALLVDVREMVARLLGRHVRNVEVDELLAADFQFVVY